MKGEVRANSKPCLSLAGLGFVLARLLPTCLSAAIVSAAQQNPPPLQITSPASGATVSPGQALLVSVTSPASLKFSQVTVFGEFPIGMSSTVATGLPEQFTIIIPKEMKCGQHVLAAEGRTASGQNVESDGITIDVERPDFPILLSANLSTLGLETQGETTRLELFATFLGGDTFSVEDSSYVSYSSSNTAVATVDASGNVTAVAAGTGYVIATYTLGSRIYPLSIPVIVQHPMLTTLPTSLVFPAQRAGTRSSSLEVTLTNVIAQAIQILSVTTGGDFSETDDCMASSPLGPNGTCTVKVTISPTGTGLRTGQLLIANSANLIPIAVSLSGIGVAPDKARSK